MEPEEQYSRLTSGLHMNAYTCLYDDPHIHTKSMRLLTVSQPAGKDVHVNRVQAVWSKGLAWAGRSAFVMVIPAPGWPLL